MSLEDRVATLEDTSRTHEVMLNMLISIGERQQELLEEIHRDTQQTQRLWVHLAKKHDWIDDDDWQAFQE